MHEVLKRMNLHGRVVLCGLIAGYTKEGPALESFATILRKRLRVQGFIILDYADRFMEGATQLGKWKMFGKLKDRETIVEGLEKAPDAINMLFTGGDIGKLVVKVLCPDSSTNTQRGGGGPLRFRSSSPRFRQSSNLGNWSRVRIAPTHAP